ncbi:MAG: pantoate--beta-alanine ligase [Candidatus Cohnella colombiensis]|uniref:Pantothenate synthetase n=1 Tax=Candidatus Cohnella colombiensis TaxID=3121368 RepID=A0AA95JCY7_9BACL|nr:MAG: pantoate--beta-alanine ligase [Cohnella sp.]
MTVQIIRTIKELRLAIAAYRADNAKTTVGYVPTMGYLHEGHASLLRQSKSENSVTILSIFVNPLQFGPQEDLDKYPRDEQRDTSIAEQAGVDIVFMPSVQEMYPSSMLTNISVAEVTAGLCGFSRPGHFDGVATVIAKLFNIIRPDRAYFGLKDAQQVAVVTQMVHDLNIPVEIVPCPIVREVDGLALSSRNVYLQEQERQQALILNQSLMQVSSYIQAGLTTEQLIDKLKESIGQKPLANIDYVEIVAYPSMTMIDPKQILKGQNSSILVAVAVKFGKTRLIDNVLVNFSEAGE